MGGRRRPHRADEPGEEAPWVTEREALWAQGTRAKALGPDRAQCGWRGAGGGLRQRERSERRRGRKCGWPRPLNRP